MKDNLAIKEEATFTLAKITPVEQTVLELVKRYEGIVYDVSTTKGMATAKTDRAALRTARVNLEAARKEEKADVLKLGKFIDSEAARIGAVIAKYEDPLAELIKAEEDRKEAEKAAKAEVERLRISTIQDNILKIRNIPLNQQGKSSTDVSAVLSRAKEIPIDDKYSEFRADAEVAKQTCIIALEKLLADTIANEEEQARIAAEREELAKLRKEAEEREATAKAQREAEEAKLAAERKKIEDERAAEEKRIADARAEEERKAQAIRDEEAARLAAEREAHEAKIRAEQEASDKIRIEQEKEAAAQRAEIARQQKELDDAKAQEAARLARLTTCPKCGHEWEVQS